MTVNMVAQRLHYDPVARKDRKAGEAFTVPNEVDADRLVRRNKAVRAHAGTVPALVDPPRQDAGDDITEHRATYETTVGKRPFMGWSAEDLKSKIGEYNRRDMRAKT